MRAVLSQRTRLVAVTAASNLMGTRPPVRAIADLAHAAGALVYVDGVHLHRARPRPLEALGADFYVCSPYKFLGPHCGVLAPTRRCWRRCARPSSPPSTDVVPERFELGTLPYELLAGTTAAVDFLAALVRHRLDGTRRERLLVSMAAVESYEDGLRARIEEGLRALPGVTVHSRAAHRTPTLLSVRAGGRGRTPTRSWPRAASTRPPGRSTRWRRRGGSGWATRGALRVGLAPYIDDGDVDRLLDGLAAFTGERAPPSCGKSRGRKRSISADQVRWVSSGACTPPVARRCIANSTPIAPDASTSAGLRVAVVASM